MKMSFKQTIQICGFSTQAEAAGYLGVRTDTLKKWCQGKNNPSISVFKELAGLYGCMDSCAYSAFEQIIDDYEFSDDEFGDIAEKKLDDIVRSKDWPCESVMQTVEAMVWLKIHNTNIAD